MCFIAWKLKIVKSENSVICLPLNVDPKLVVPNEKKSIDDVDNTDNSKSKPQQFMREDSGSGARHLHRELNDRIG